MNWLDAVERTVTALGYDLVDTERSAGGLLRVSIDRIPGKAYDTGVGEFITVDDCEKVTRQLQQVLEVETAPYERLEVSSPGLDRPLKRESDYQRFVGEQVALTLKMPFQGRKKYQGVLERGDGEGQWRVVLEVESAKLAKGGKARLKPLLPRQEGVVGAASAALPAANAPQTALGFTLAEVREARLVPVLDFKGRRFAVEPQVQQQQAHALQTSSVDEEPVTGDQVDGGRDK